MYDFVPVANRLMTKDDIKKQLYNMMDQLPLHGGSNGSMLPLVQIEEVIAEIKFKELVKQIDNALSKPRTKRRKLSKKKNEN